MSCVSFYCHWNDTIHFVFLYTLYVLNLTEKKYVSIPFFLQTKKIKAMHEWFQQFLKFEEKIHEKIEIYLFCFKIFVNNAFEITRAEESHLPFPKNVYFYPSF